jgi:phage terminase large subunit-like protein
MTTSARLNQMTTDIAQIKPALLGAIEPRLHSSTLTGDSFSHEIEELAEQIGMPLMPWQKWVLKDMMTVDDAGMFIRKSNLLLIARQNGKTHLASMRIIWGLTKGEKIVAMSSNRSMALDTFRNVVWIMEHNEFLAAQMSHKPRLANGQEMIQMKNGGKYEIVAATRDGSRGRTADFLFIDELREIDEEGFKAATPVTRARPNAQSLFVSNAGDSFSVTLNQLRERALSYPPESLGFYEYSAPQFAKIDDRQAWALANPALGHTITEETLEEAVTTSTIETTRTEMLCQWIDSLASPWPHGVLEDTSDSSLLLNHNSRSIFAFDVSPSRRYASLVAGQVLEDGRIAVGILQKWESMVAVDDQKIAVDIKAWADKYRPRMVCYDKYATQTIADKLKNGGVMVQDISGSAFYQACGDLLDALVTHKLVHNGNPEWIQNMNNVAAKENDSAWRIVKRKSAGDISAAIGTAMIVHQLLKPQSTPMIIAV